MKPRSADCPQPTNGPRRWRFSKNRLRVYGHADDVRAWTDLGHVLFNLKEFLFVN